MQKTEKIPEGKLARSYIGGKTAVNVGGKVISYLVKKPFLSKTQKEKAKSELNQTNAEVIFKALILLKGTALKIAQMLSMEMEIIPKEIRLELEKSYNQVPPLNRATIRKVIQNEFGVTPEKLFEHFKSEAFAAASLGQVHLAGMDIENNLAVKIQYPGIAGTIKSDMQLVKNLIRPLPEYKLIRPSLIEIEKKLQEEVDYEKEADNHAFFYNNLNINHVVIPKVHKHLSGRTVLTTDRIHGLSLDTWIKEDHCQEDRDLVANRLNDIFITSLYTLNHLHADPNPGNFIIMDNLDLGLIDFGCTKKFDPNFIKQYAELMKTAQKKDRNRYFNIARKMKIMNREIDKNIETEVFRIMFKMSDIFSRLYQTEFFDFGENTSFIQDLTQCMKEFHPYMKYFDSNPEFVFLDRTRYGLFRIFGKMKARVKIRNTYEYEA